MSEKGLNRMSNITLGRAQSTSSSSIPPLHDGDHQRPPSHLLDQTNAKPVVVGEATTSSSLKHSVIYEISTVNSLDVRGQAELKLPKPETDKDAISTLIVGERDKLQPLQEKSSLQKASTNAEILQKPCRNQPNFFSSKTLNSCIIASEKTRSLCALLIALFVLLSYIDYPLLGMNIVRSEGIVASRPLYIILLTDLTVVISRLFLYKKGYSEEAEEDKAAFQNNRHNWEGAVKLLERGLVVYQTIRAPFIDYSIYAVVVICGLSLI
ncbi:hypothetical protein CRYUN_Cryun37aG0045400 [Craigia yunnanensis]